MALGFGANGEVLPDIDETWNLDSLLVYNVNARARTYAGRELYNPEYGIDLLRFTGLEQRTRVSLRQINGYRLRNLRVRRVAPQLIIDALLQSQVT